MILKEPGSSREIRFGSRSKWTLAVVFLLLATPALINAELELVERIVVQQCSQLRADGDLKRYEAWIEMAKNEAIEEFETAFEEVGRYSKKWLDVREGLLDALQDMKRQQQYAPLILEASARADRYTGMGVEVVKLTGEMEKASDPAVKRDKQNRIAKLENDMAGELESLLSMQKTDDFKAADKFFSTGGPVSPHILFLAKSKAATFYYRKKVDGKDLAIKKTIDDLETERKAVKKKFKKARENYEDARLILAAINEIDQRIKQCAAGQSPGSLIAGTPDVLSADWILRGTPMRNYESCSSGSLIILFDENGNAIDGTMKMDCAVAVVTYDPAVVEGGGVERSVQCPPPNGPVVFAYLANIVADSSSGTILADTINPAGEPVGQFTGSYEQIGKVPPYRYKGMGSVALEGASFRWHSHQPLKCQ